jgi:hypothetical protein
MVNPFKRKIVRNRKIKEKQGKMLMHIAEQRGKIEIKPNLTLYSAAGMAALELKDSKGNAIEFIPGAFYLALPHIAYRCAEPLTIFEAMKATKDDLHETIASKESVLMPIGKNPQLLKNRIELPIRMGRRKVYLYEPSNMD